MSPADPRRRWPAAKACPVAEVVAVLFLIVVVAVAALLFPPPARAVAAPASSGTLTVTMDRVLTLLDETSGIVVSGDALAGGGGASTLIVRLTGPATISDLRRSTPFLPPAGGFSAVIDLLPSAARPGSATVHLPIPRASLPAEPGAYLVTVEVNSGYVLLATGSTWMGRVDRGDVPLDLAFVWRAALGIHRDAAGTFFDRTLEQACSAIEPANLSALANLSGRFPEWRFSLGVEPILLTQLRDMADGYSRADDPGTAVEVGADDPAAQNAASVLTQLAETGNKQSVEVAISPFAGPDLGLLGAEGWRDGLDQVQLGKQEVLQTMRLGLAPNGAWSPDLDLSSDGLGDYGGASMDHVLVDARVAEAFAEPIGKETVAIRARNDESDRVTLVLADSDLRTLMAPPWDPVVLLAGIATVLASSHRDALVLTPDPEFALPPGSYLDALGEELQKDSWIRTQTMSDLLRSHPPDTRPVLFERASAPLSGYIAETIFSAVRDAHALVDDLAVMATSVSLPLEEARRLIFVAESCWWSRPGVTPRQASAGLGYATQSEATAQSELEKVDLTALHSGPIFGREGTATLVAENHADYRVTAELKLAGQGLRFPEGNVVQVELAPGGNEVTIPVMGSGKVSLTAQLIAGDSVLGETSGNLRFITLANVLPWVIVAIAVLGGIFLGLIYRRGRRRRRAA